MKIIPAIDIIDGKCVRLRKGDYDQKTIYNDDPLQIAKMFEDKGFKHLHIVDLDGAKAGKVINLKTLEKIAQNTKLTLDFGGGIKDETTLKSVLNAGSSQVTIGSLAVKNKILFQEWILTYGAKKFILGADVKGRNIAVSGWLETSDVNLFDFIAEYVSLGIRDVLCTDISKDGMLQGPAFDLYDELMLKFPDLQLIASGGVSKIEDVIELKDRKIPAVVIGKAIYEKRLDLDVLIKLSSPLIPLQRGETLK